MNRNIAGLIVFMFCIPSFADEVSKIEVRAACRAAAAGMPNGNGATVYYPDGTRLTASAGTAGATWYYPNGSRLTTSMGNPGTTFYYANGARFSTSTGTAGATWYYSNGSRITADAPLLNPKEMADLACDLIIESLDKQ